MAGLEIAMCVIGLAIVVGIQPKEYKDPWYIRLFNKIEKW